MKVKLKLSHAGTVGGDTLTRDWREAAHSPGAGQGLCNLPPTPPQ